MRHELTDRPTALERAFDLARSGTCANVTDVRTQLKAEGYAYAQIQGNTLKRQLNQLCDAAAQKKA